MQRLSFSQLVSLPGIQLFSDAAVKIENGTFAWDRQERAVLSE